MLKPLELSRRYRKSATINYNYKLYLNPLSEAAYKHQLCLLEANQCLSESFPHTFKSLIQFFFGGSKYSPGPGIEPGTLSEN